MTRTNQLTSPHLRPPTADLNRLLAGEHHDPHSILGAHEYGDHTVVRAYRPHAVQVVALVGGERYVFSHIESGLFAVALPFTDLADYRLEIGYEGGGDSPVVHALADAYRFLPTLGESGSASVRRGPPRTTVGDPRRSPAQLPPPASSSGVSFAVGANAKGVKPDLGEFNLSGQRRGAVTRSARRVVGVFWPASGSAKQRRFRVPAPTDR
jgi:1,4-alpha-glucan branching enzyme